MGCWMQAPEAQIQITDVSELLGWMKSLSGAEERDSGRAVCESADP